MIACRFADNGVVKTDAYGHGEVRIACELQSSGGSFSIGEAILLREAGVLDAALILGYTPVELAGELLKCDITQTLLLEKYAEQLLPYSDDIKR